MRWLGPVVIVFVLVFTPNLPLAQGTVPTMMSFQGRLDQSGAPVNGQVDLTVTLHKHATTITPQFTELHASTPVQNGVFTILLGSQTPGGIPGIVFSATELWLSVSINGAPDLTPRTRIAAAAYANVSLMAERLVQPGSSTTVVDTTPAGNVRINGGSATKKLNVNGGFQVFDDLAEGITLTTDDFTFNEGTSEDPVYAYNSANDTHIFYTEGGPRLAIDANGGVGIGTTAPDARLHVRGPDDAFNGPVLILEGNQADQTESGRIRFMENTGDLRGGFIAYDGLQNKLNIGHHSAADLDPASDVSMLTLARNTQNVGINTESPLADLHILGDVTLARLLLAPATTGTNGHSQIEMAEDHDFTFGMRLNYDGSGNRLHVEGVSSGATVGKHLTIERDGNVGVGVENPTVDLDVAGTLGIRNDAGLHTLQIDGSAATGAGITGTNGSGVDTLSLRSGDTAGAQLDIYSGNGVGGNRVSVSNGQVRLYNDSGVQTMVLDGQHSTDGASRVTTQKLEITGGSDLSEQFDVTTPSGHVEPGMVVCIDPENIGRLMISTRRYDRTVAGVVSGGGGVSTGMLMSQLGSEADGKHPIALTGRVYVQADASYGAIRPGDLMTTSDTPGHAMKVTDHSRAPGAILGKAMSVLDRGRGLVLILVTLQ